MGFERVLEWWRGGDEVFKGGCGVRPEFAEAVRRVFGERAEGREKWRMVLRSRGGS